jgi:hypothetical protein
MMERWNIGILKEWNDGILEEWNIGYWKNGDHTQCSNIPVFRYSRP